MAHTTLPDDADLEALRRAALACHDVPKHVIDQVLALALDLQTRILSVPRKRRRELAGMLDLATGDPIGAITRGEADKVDANEQLAAAQGRPVVSVHTHPGNSAFSHRDLEVFFDAPEIQVLVVIAADGTLYVMSPKPGTPKNPSYAYSVEGDFTKMINARVGIYRALRRRGLLTEAQAWREQTHEAWTALGPALGLRYDRV
jgi:hypothetical protein